jgi:Flp pilus assembly pilin Flp
MFVVCRLLVQERAAVTSIEYAMIAFFIGIAAVVGATSIGTTVSGFFNSFTAGL